MREDLPESRRLGASLRLEGRGFALLVERAGFRTCAELRLITRNDLGKGRRWRGLSSGKAALQLLCKKAQQFNLNKSSQLACGRPVGTGRRVLPLLRVSLPPDAKRSQELHLPGGQLCSLPSSPTPPQPGNAPASDEGLGFSLGPAISEVAEDFSPHHPQITFLPTSPNAR